MNISDTIYDGWETYQEGYSTTFRVLLHVRAASSLGHTYLSELQPQKTNVGKGTFSMGKYEFTSSDPRYKINQGDSIVVHDVQYNHGLFAHAPSRLSYNLYGDFVQLITTIGLVDWIDCGDGVQFIVLLDGKEIYRSPTMRSSSIPLKIEVSVAGGRNLELIVDPLANPDCDWAIWCDPSLR